MICQIRNRVSSAHALALVALFVGLAGGAGALPGKNRVDSGDVKNETIRGKDVRDAKLSGQDLAQDSVTGADVDEGSLDGVTDTCPSPATVRFGRICAGSDGATREWFAAVTYCTQLGLELPTVTEASALAIHHDVPGVPAGGDLWTNDAWSEGGDARAWAVSEDGGAISTSQSIDRVAVCTTSPSDAR